MTNSKHPTDSNQNELLPCPFCGSKPVITTEGSIHLNVWIKCTQCDQALVCTDWYGGDMGLTEACWNSRTPISIDQNRSD